MNKNDFAEELIKNFPEKREVLIAHYKEHGEILAHILFADEISTPLVTLLTDDQNEALIRKYCAFIEKMWQSGSEDIKNVVDVTILENLSDDEVVWMRFGRCISKNFKRYINDCALQQNAMLWAVPKL